MASKIALIKLIWFCCCGISWAQATAVITGPTQSAAGDLIILDATQSRAEAFAWTLTNSQKSYLIFEDGTKLVFASGAAGQYIFCLATSQSGVDGSAASVAIGTHTVTVGTVPTPPDPKPDDPDPPKPEPLTGIALECRQEIEQTSATQAERDKLADNLEDVATQSAAMGWTADQMSDELRTLNRVDPFNSTNTITRWGTWPAWFGGVMEPLTTQKDVAAAFADIVRGLRTDTVPNASRRSADPANESLKGMVDGLRGSLQTLKREVGE